MKKISSKYLRDLGACDEGIAEFEAIFGEADVDVTMENCLKVDQTYVYWLAVTAFDDAIKVKYYRAISASADAYYADSNDYYGDKVESGFIKLREDQTIAFVALWKEQHENN